MKGQYKNKKGELIQVKLFDAANKMVYVERSNGQNKWYHEPDYSTWVNTADEHLGVLSSKIQTISEESKPIKKANDKANKK